MSSTDITWKITGKGAGGQCQHCPRKLATHYVITSSNGQVMTVGRGCLKKVTGWTVTAAQAEAALRLARRAETWAAWSAANPEAAALVGAAADREAEEIRQRRRIVAGPAQELRQMIGDRERGWQDMLACYLQGR